MRINADLRRHGFVRSMKIGATIWLQDEELTWYPVRDGGIQIHEHIATYYDAGDRWHYIKSNKVLDSDTTFKRLATRHSDPE